MIDVLRGASCVLAATIAGSSLGAATFLSVEAAVSSWSEVQQELAHGPVLLCALAPIPVNTTSQEMRDLYCTAEPRH